MIYNWFLNSQKWWEEMCVVHKSWFRPIKRYYQTNCPGAIIVLMLIIYMAKTNFWKWEIRETKQDPTRSSSPATNEKLLPNKLPGGHSHEQTRKNWFAFLLIRKRQCDHCYNHIWWYMLKNSPRRPFIVWNLNYTLMYTWHF